VITFYDCSTAPSPRRARILLAEKYIPHVTVQVDLRSGEHMGDAFRAINPQCTVPVLRLDGGELLTDNAGITAWAEASHPEPALMGRSPLEKAAIASWQSRIEFEGLYAIAEALRNASPAMVNRALPGPINYEQIPALAERGQRRVQQFFDTLDQQLAGRDCIAGEGFSIADITAIVCVDFARVIKQRPDARHANLLRWHAAVSQRRSMAL
jgi:glutathione S-transferase